MKVLIAGDFCPQHRVADAFDRGEFEKVLGEVKPVLDSVDYSIVNLECPIVERDSFPVQKLGPNLKCKKNGLEAIKSVGFNCVTLANNHFLDYGVCGVRDTINSCKLLNIDTVGGGVNLIEASHILYKDISGEKLAVINCCEHEFSIATEINAGSNPLDPIRQYRAIQDARKNADYVLVIIHGGHEHFPLPSPRMIENYRFFIDVGADAVVNHHQHCFSGYEIYQGKPIFYGIGNFCFDYNGKRNSLWNEGYLVKVFFSKDGVTSEIIPYRQCDDTPSVQMLSKDVYDERIKGLKDTITNSERLNDKIKDYYEKCVEDYSNLFEPFYNKYYLGAKHRGWLPSFISKKRKIAARNYIECEAHRDKLMYWLKNNKN